MWLTHGICLACDQLKSPIILQIVQLQTKRCGSRLVSGKNLLEDFKYLIYIENWLDQFSDRFVPEEVTLI